MVTREAVFTSLIRQCSVSRSLVQGRQVHEAIVRSGYQQDTFLGNLLIQMYASCGQVQDCLRVFDGLPHKNVFSWNLLLSAHSANGLTSEAWFTFLSMHRRDHVSWSTILGALTTTDPATALLIFERSPCRGLFSYTALLSIVEPEQAKQLFDQMPQRDSISWNAMAAVLVQHKDLKSAQAVFRRMPEHSVSSCNVVLTAYAQSGHMQSAIQLFQKMPHRSVVSWMALLQGHFQNSSSLEIESCMLRMPQHNVAAWNSLLQSFVCKGRLQEAESVFKSIPQPDAASWTLMLTLYADSGHLSVAIRAFERIFPADVVACNAMLHAYSIAGFVDQARLLFDRMCGRNCLSWNTLLAAFANGGVVQSALSVFQRMPQRGIIAWNTMLRSYILGQSSTDVADFFWLLMPCRDVLSWTTMLTRFCASLDLLDLFEKMPQRDLVAWSVVMKATSQSPGGSKTVLLLFHKMQLEGLTPDSAIYSSVVNACSSMNTLSEAMAIHGEMLAGCLDAVTATSLITLYGKHGWVDGAKSIFDSLDDLDAAAWNAMIAAFAHCGDRRRATELFKEMQLEGMDPSGATFTSLLYCWSHAGSISAGFQAVASLQSDHAMQLDVDHYVCVLDLLARSGKLAEAQNLVSGLDCSAAWGAFLSACKSHGESRMGTSAGRRLLQLSPDSSAPYVLLSQCCTDASVD